jgi:uncharacterized protein (DUF1015 family)
MNSNDLPAGTSALPDLAPFHGIRYAADLGALDDVLAPPYDVVDAAQAEALRGRSPFNCVRLVLPEGEAPERYETAARDLASWEAEGVLERDATPSVYVYRQTYDLDGSTIERRALFAALRLTPFEAGEVLPHEHTHRGPKKDRLALWLACHAQLSPIFVIGEDGEGELLETLRSVETDQPLLAGQTPDGIVHAFWRVSDEEEAARFCALGSAGPLLIADGHHRYETSLAAAAARPDEVGARRTLCCIVSELDPGLNALPTHRALATSLADGNWIDALAEVFEIDLLEPGQPEAAAERVASADEPALGLILPGRAAYLLRPRPSAIEAGGIAPSRVAIGAVLFDRLVLHGVLGTTADEAAAEGILTYHRRAEETSRVAGEAGAAFLLAPVTVDAVRAAVADGSRLPAKTTYFSPKMPTGLVFRPW